MRQEKKIFYAAALLAQIEAAKENVV